MRNLRTNVVLWCAVVGAIVAAVFAPAILQALFVAISSMTRVEPTPGPLLAPTSRTSEVYQYAGHPGSYVSVALLGLVVGAGIGNLIALAFQSWERMDTSDKVTMFVGVFAGIVGSFPFLFVFAALGNVAAPLATLGMTVGFGALAVYALRSMRDVLPWYKVEKRPTKTGIKILDTNVIIDGRIVDVARTGFLEGKIYVPRFVLEELQHIADSADPLRRQRGRRGLDILRLMQDEHDLEVGTQDRLVSADEEVDSRLVKLATALGADLVTNDVNLNRVAKLQSVPVLNLNDLAMAMKPNVLPRETLTLPIVREGNQLGQGVGYLEDGTMVVVESAKRHIGDTIDVMVTQVIQTERGKMIFGEVAEPSTDTDGQAVGFRTRKPQSKRFEHP